MKAKTQFSWQQCLILLLAIISIGITASLGAWQLRRAAYKEQLAQQIQKQKMLPELTNTALTASDFVANASDQSAWLQRRARLQGRWLHDKTVFLDNRPMVFQGSQRVGFYVATPLALEGSNRVIWVQRGWVQRDFQDRMRLPELAQSQGNVMVQGRLMAHISKAYEMRAGFATSEQAAEPQSASSARPSRIWQNLPMVDFGSQTALPIALLQTESEAGSDGLQRDWPAADTGVAKHHGYAFQWFALSALLVILYVWFQLIAPRRRSK